MHDSLPPPGPPTLPPRSAAPTRAAASGAAATTTPPSPLGRDARDVRVGLLDADPTDALVAQPWAHGGAAEPADEPRWSWATFGGYLGALATVIVAIALSYAVPELARFRPWAPGDPLPFWNLVGRELLGEGRSEQAKSAAVAELATTLLAPEAPLAPKVIPPRPPEVAESPSGSPAPPLPAPHPDDALPVPRSLDDPSGKALDRFFAQLARTERGEPGAITRIGHWGDSAIGLDHVSAPARERMQARFGDAGHGFHLITPSNTSYRHKGVEFRELAPWELCFVIFRCREDGRYGYGGTVFWSAGGGRSRFATVAGEGFGSAVSRFEVWYAARPRGGRIEVRVDRGEPIVVDTALATATDGEADATAAAGEDRWHTVAVADGAHEFDVRAAGGGRVTLYGVVLERDGPGVVWDGLSQVGAFTNRLAAFDRAHIHGQVARRGVNLVVLTLGGNDLLATSKSMPTYRDELRQVLELLRGPDRADCLVMGPVDHGVRVDGRIESNPMVAKITDAQRRVAAEQGCAFFDTLAVMGGDGGAAAWRRHDPPLLSGDLAHLTPAGSTLMGRMLYLALMEQYRGWGARQRAGG